MHMCAMRHCGWRSLAELAESLDGFGGFCQNVAVLRFAIKFQKFDDVQEKALIPCSASSAGSTRTGSFLVGNAFILHVVGTAVKRFA